MTDLEKKDSVAVLNVQDLPMAQTYAYSTECPPPAYTKPKSVTVKVAKIVATSCLLACFILGFCIVASSYVQTLARCDCSKKSGDPSEVPRAPPIREALVQEAPAELVASPLPPPPASFVGAPKKAKKLKRKPTTTTTTTTESTRQDEIPIVDGTIPEDNGFLFPIIEPILNDNVLVPLSFSWDDMARKLLEETNLARMNCVMERHVSRGGPLSLPPIFQSANFSDLRIHGEQMVMNCDSHRALPLPSPDDPEDRAEPVFSMRSTDPIPIPLPLGLIPPREAPETMDPSSFLVPPDPDSSRTPYVRESRSFLPQHVILPRSADASRSRREKRCACACD